MKSPATKVLLVEDERAHIRLIERAFSQRPDEFDLTIASSLEEARLALARTMPDVAILDWLLPDGMSSELLNDIQENPEFPVVVMTSHGSEEVAVEAMKAGVIDYVVKQPETLRDIPRLVDRVLREWGHVVERARAEKELERYREHLEELVESRTRELMESRERLRQAERLASVGTLAAGIAHEINNPIGSILAIAQFALISADRDEPGESWEEALSEIERQAIRCGKIVKSVLQFSRNRPTDKWDADLRDIVRWVHDASRPYGVECGVDLRVEIAAEALVVRMNPTEMQQVLLNVIRNAFESSDAGQSVILRCERRSDLACVEVCDQGRGIAPEDLRRIFDPFYTTRLRDGGSGLGLSVAHGLVEEHAGTLVAESQLGDGTTIRMELPLSAPPP